MSWSLVHDCKLLVYFILQMVESLCELAEYCTTVGGCMYITAVLLFTLVLVSGALEFLGVNLTCLSLPLRLLVAIHGWWFIGFIVVNGLVFIEDEIPFWVCSVVFAVIDLVTLGAGSLGSVCILGSSAIVDFAIFTFRSGCPVGTLGSGCSLSSFVWFSWSLFCGLPFLMSGRLS